MAEKFVISRFAGGRRLASCWGDFRTDYLEDDAESLKRCLGYLNLGRGDPALLETLQDALERFYRLEARSLAKFGEPKLFRIWRVDSKVLPIEVTGGWTEPRGHTRSDATLKRCLEETLANLTLLPHLKRELAAFLQQEDDAR